jgi:hypothetical protein
MNKAIVLICVLVLVCASCGRQKAQSRVKYPTPAERQRKAKQLEMEEAVARAEHIRIKNEMADTCYFLGLSLLAQGKNKEVIAKTGECILGVGERYHLLQNLAFALYRDAQYDSSREVCRKLLAQNLPLEEEIYTLEIYIRVLRVIDPQHEYEAISKRLEQLKAKR